MLKTKRIHEIGLLKVVLIRGIQRDLVVNWISFTSLTPVKWRDVISNSTAIVFFQVCPLQFVIHWCKAASQRYSYNLPIDYVNK